ncbi:MAG: indole-3-glycerol phosphate synthase TrpC [Flavobacteriaceae bacterium]|nr:indole-3-glycerol phosphate synthase TrpC [Flavobacteriaceae bacterium]
MNILDKIIADKRKEVILKKSLIPAKQMEGYALFERPTVSLAKALTESNSGIIAEFKRRSPSKASINQSAKVAEIATLYQEAKVCGMSVLTDGTYFGGSLDDFLMARASVKMPLLRKEFIIDEYQILEAKAHGADVILLIASVLSRSEIKRLSEFAKSLGLEILLEVHNQEELEKALMPSLDMLGVNNRNLKSFEVSIEISKVLAELIPDQFVKVSESGISSIQTVKELKDYGYKGFLMGEHFMKTEHPGKSAAAFINELSS